MEEGRPVQPGCDIMLKQTVTLSMVLPGPSSALYLVPPGQILETNPGMLYRPWSLTLPTIYTGNPAPDPSHPNYNMNQSITLITTTQY